MSPHALFCNLAADGITLKVSLDGRGLAVPAGKLTVDQRALVLAHKPELIAFLTETGKTTARLIEVAMRACDHFNDNAFDREAMRLDCLTTPPHLQSELIKHFEKNYPK